MKSGVSQVNSCMISRALCCTVEKVRSHRVSVLETMIFCHRFSKINNSAIKDFLTKFINLAVLSKIHSERSALNLIRIGSDWAFLLHIV